MLYGLYRVDASNGMWTFTRVRIVNSRSTAARIALACGWFIEESAGSLPETFTKPAV